MKKVKVNYNDPMSEQNYKEIFEEAMNQLHQEYTSCGQESEFILWFNFEYVEDTISEITVSVPSSFMGKQMENKGNFKKVQNKISEISGMEISIKYIVKPKTINNESKPVQFSAVPAESNSSTNNSSSVETPKPAVQKTEESSFKKHSQLRQDYRFETFVPGDNSMYAYNASLAASKNPGKAYNPILIYGGVGLGKTHLMQAIGNYIYNENEKMKIGYISAENFTNEFTSSIFDKKTEQFKKKYRNLDVLLLDDIHFLQGKEATQEELFHTFESIYNKQGQIVFTCDRPVTELKGITDRLRSRFSRGLNVDLQPPSYENRLAIINKKLEIQGKEIPSDVKEYLAKNCQTNVRDLEASITKLIGYRELVGKELTIPITQDLLRDTFSSPLSGTITVETVQKVVADHFNISISDIKGKKHEKKIAIPRHIAVYISRNLTEYSFPELGNEFGGRDHTTIMHSYEKVEEQIKTDTSLNSTIQQLIREIKDYKK